MRITKEVQNKTKQSGQYMLEAILLMLLFVAAGTVVQKRFKDGGFISAMVAGPWSRIAGMMSNGNWKPVEAGRALHPQSDNNVMSREGDQQ